tara:strand:- start:1806 stop:2093 length:288 start_codon:yes stop_codon:yes gene_type:complete
MPDPFDEEEAAVWNFLLFFCLGSDGATLDDLSSWLSDGISEARLFIALSSLVQREAVDSDDGRYFPIVQGEAYRNVGVAWDDLFALAVVPGRTIH